MVFCGFCEQVRHGEIYLNAMGHGKQYQAVFTAGRKWGYGSGF